MTDRLLHLRRVASATALGLLAGLVALIVAPQALMAGFAVTAGWGRHGVVLLPGVVAYEAGLWGSGLAVLLGAWRLGFERDRLPIIVVFATILAVEAALSLLTGTPLAAYGWLTGIIVRLLTGAAAIFLALRLVQPRR